MRIRQRLVRNPGTMSRTCRLRSSLDVVRTYHESCNKSPATLHVEDEVKRKGPQLEGLLQTYKGCSTILDERPKYFRYGNCLSVKQYYAPYAETELTLVHETASESSKDFVGCGNSDWVTSSSMTRFELGFKGVETARSYQPHAKAKYLSYEDWINSPKRFDLQLEAMESFIPDLENGFSLPVFLMEFRDLPRLAQDVKRAFQAMKSAILGLIALIKGNSGAARRKRKKLRALLTMSISEISGDFLSYNFGWLPFVGEVTEIISRIMTFKEDLDRFFKWNGKYMTLHYQKWLAPETFRDAEWLNTTQATSNTISATSSQWDFADDVFNAVYFDGTISRSVSDVRYTATCFFRYSFSGGDALYNRIWAGLDRFGINLSDRKSVV